MNITKNSSFWKMSNLTTGSKCWTMEDLWETSKDGLEPIYMSMHLALCISSLVVSGFNIIIFSRPQMMSSIMNNFFMALEISNLIFSVHFLPVTILRLVNPVLTISAEYRYAYSYLFVMAYASMFFNVWMTVIINTWRCIALVWPVKAPKLLTKTRTWCIIFALASVCLCAIIAVFASTFKLDYQMVSMCHGGTSVMYKLIYYNEKSVSVYVKSTWTMAIAFFFIPAALLLIISISLIWIIFFRVYVKGRFLDRHESPNSQSTKTTMCLILLLSAFLVSNATPHVSILVNFPTGQHDFKYPWDYICNEFLLGLLMNTISICAYYYMGSNFRRTFHEIFSVQSVMRKLQYLRFKHNW